MSIISNLLALEIMRLQQMDKGDNSAVEILKKSQDRISILADLYSLLYQNDRSVQQADCNRFFTTLLDLIQDLFPERHNIVFHADITVDTLPLTVLMPLGLIVNEIVSNVFKHAFGESDEGRVNLVLDYKDDTTVRMHISDNGQGISHDLEAMKQKSLGVRLVEGFVSQIDGTLALESDDGVSYDLEFPYEPND